MLHTGVTGQQQQQHEIKKNEMSRASGKDRGEEKYIQFKWVNLEDCQPYAPAAFTSKEIFTSVTVESTPGP
jgi:hypothetical protein